MNEIELKDLEEKKTYLMEYVEMTDNDIEAIHTPIRVKKSVRRDYQLITIIQIELPFYVISANNGFNYIIIRFSGNEKFYIPSKDFLDKFKKEKRCRNCC